MKIPIVETARKETGKHKVLVFGTNAFGHDKPSVLSGIFDVRFEDFPREWSAHERASEYELIILDYSAFWIAGSHYGSQQEMFEKELIQALDKGSSVCFLCYDDYTPYGENVTYTGLDLIKKQIGYRFLASYLIQPINDGSPIHAGVLKRGEFKTYVNKWGTSKILFNFADGKSPDDIIVSFNNSFLAFSNNVRKGMVIYLPCQRDFNRPKDTASLFTVLIDTLITYVTKMRTELPPFAEQPFFNSEKKLQERLIALYKETDEIEKMMEPYRVAKAVAFAGEYRLEDLLPKFIADQLEMPVEKNEKFNEDFWILDLKDKKRSIVCEIKSCGKGFKKNGIYDIYNHRTSNDLDDAFPAVLFVNQNLNASSWDRKDTLISPQDYKVATENNVLIVRIEDLLNMWDNLIEGKITKENIFELFTTNKGWLLFKSDGSFEIKQ